MCVSVCVTVCLALRYKVTRQTRTNYEALLSLQLLTNCMVALSGTPLSINIFKSKSLYQQVSTRMSCIINFSFCSPLTSLVFICYVSIRIHDDKRKSNSRTLITFNYLMSVRTFLAVCHLEYRMSNMENESLLKLNLCNILYGGYTYLHDTQFNCCVH